jgi:UDP-N-acetylmuramate dehydrogenase
VIVEVALQLAPQDASRLRASKAVFSARRAWMKGLHSAGSIFKNPPGNIAGRLIEQAGLKGRRIGGAQICEQHANVIVTDTGATASDVLALLETARAGVQAKFKVTLDPEIRILE